MTVIVELNIIPLGEGTSLSKSLSPAIAALKKRGVKYMITPMCTIFEAESIREAFEIACEAHESIFKAGVKRVVTTVKIDDRRDVVKRRMEDKVKSLESNV